MRILRELHAEGHTVIIVTHDAQVAANANRIIEIRDGQIIADRSTQLSNPAHSAPQAEAQSNQSVPPHAQNLAQNGGKPWFGLLDRFRQAALMATRTMLAHRMRTF